MNQSGIEVVEQIRCIGQRKACSRGKFIRSKIKQHEFDRVTQRSNFSCRKRTVKNCLWNTVLIHFLHTKPCAQGIEYLSQRGLAHTDLRENTNSANAM